MSPQAHDGNRLRFSAGGRRDSGWILPGFAIMAALPATLLIGLLMPLAARAQTTVDSTVVLSWTATGDDGFTGTATSYACRYRTVSVAGSDTLSWWNAATPVQGLPVPGPAGSIDSFRVRGLVPATTYYFIIRLADEVPNWSGYSNIAQVATSSDVTPPAAITSLAVMGTTGTTVALRWTAPGGNGATGTAASYDIRYWTTAISSANFASATAATGEPSPAAAGTVQTFTITGLAGSRTYFVAMRTTDAAGNVSVISNVVSGVTLDGSPPAAVTDLSIRR